jgi:putative tributyrin esterase
MTLLHLALLVAVSAPSAAAGELRVGTFNSKSLGRDVSYTVQLPPSYAAGGGPYPVVYALHGLFEGEGFWQRRSLSTLTEDLWTKGALPEFLIVAVDGGNSFFLNSSLGKYEDLVVADTVAHVEDTYRVKRGRAHRGLLGISMGGYAALRIAFTRPEVFGAVATHSAMLLTEPPTLEGGAGRGQMAAFSAVFGRPIDPALWQERDPLRLVEKAPRDLPRLYLDCGESDRYGLAAGHKELQRRLTSRGAVHEMHLLPGDHGYEYVRTVLPRSLAFLASGWKSAPRP